MYKKLNRRLQKQTLNDTIKYIFFNGSYMMLRVQTQDRFLFFQDKVFFELSFCKTLETRYFNIDVSMSTNKGFCSFYLSNNSGDVLLF